MLFTSILAFATCAIAAPAALERRLSKEIGDLTCISGSGSVNSGEMSGIQTLWDNNTPNLDLAGAGAIIDYAFDDPGYMIINGGTYFQVLNHNAKHNTINQDDVRNAISFFAAHNGGRCLITSNSGYGINYYGGEVLSGYGPTCGNVGDDCSGSWSKSKLIAKQ